MIEESIMMLQRPRFRDQGLGFRVYLDPAEPIFDTSIPPS